MEDLSQIATDQLHRSWTGEWSTNYVGCLVGEASGWGNEACHSWNVKQQLDLLQVSFVKNEDPLKIDGKGRCFISIKNAPFSGSTFVHFRGFVVNVRGLLDPVRRCRDYEGCNKGLI